MMHRSASCAASEEGKETAQLRQDSIPCLGRKSRLVRHTLRPSNAVRRLTPTYRAAIRGRPAARDDSVPRSPVRTTT